MKNLIITIMFSLIGLNSNAADFTIQLQPANNSVSDPQVSSISSSKMSDFVSSVTALINSAISSLVSQQELTPENLIINGDFRINQRGYVSGAGLSSNQYGHDRWKAVLGAGYSFTASSEKSVLTLSSPIRQVIEGSIVKGGSYTLSWEGSAVCKLEMGNSTVGSASSSPIVLNSVSAGSNLTVDCMSGTLSNVQLNEGLRSYPFQKRHISQELVLAKRYYQKLKINHFFERMVGASPEHTIYFQGQMRAIPTVVLFLQSHSINSGTINSYPILSTDESSFTFAIYTSSVGVAGTTSQIYTADAEIY